MATYEAVCGIAESDNQYAYIAIRPPLGEDRLAVYADRISPNYMQGNYVLRAAMDDEVTELEIWAPKPHTSEKIIGKLIARLREVVEVGGNSLTPLPGEIAVEGDRPLFEQYNEQQRQLQATQNS